MENLTDLEMKENMEMHALIQALPPLPERTVIEFSTHPLRAIIRQPGKEPLVVTRKDSLSEEGLKTCPVCDGTGKVNIALPIRHNGI